MFKDMSKLEKAGLVIGAIECVAGFGFAIYAHCKCKKAMLDNNETVDKIIEETNEIIDELVDLTDKGEA